MFADKISTIPINKSCIVYFYFLNDPFKVIVENSLPKIQKGTEIVFFCEIICSIKPRCLPSQMFNNHKVI